MEEKEREGRKKIAREKKRKKSHLFFVNSFYLPPPHPNPTTTKTTTVHPLLQLLLDPRPIRLHHRKPLQHADDRHRLCRPRRQRLHSLGAVLQEELDEASVHGDFGLGVSRGPDSDSRSWRRRRARVDDGGSVSFFDRFRLFFFAFDFFLILFFF